MAVAAGERVFVLYALHPMARASQAIEERGALKAGGEDFIRQVS
jgi:hypothetical protein